jgi:hypothetical protein
VYRLQDGDRLTAVATVADLDRVAQRAAVPANWAVEVLSFPVTARGDLVLRARALGGLSAETAEALVNGTPFVLAGRQTRGQAEELLGLLQREKVSARLVEKDAAQ